MNTSTGYGPSSRYSRLYFNGDASKYEIWEEKFIGYLRTQKLKEAVCSTADPLTPELAAKNEEAYAELILLIDDSSLALIRNDAKDDCRQALKLLHEHYAGKGKPRVISLYTELTSLRKSPEQTATEYMLKAEEISTSLIDAGETISDSLVIAMLLKGLPQSYNAFIAVVTQSEDTYNDFAKFKVALKNFDDTLQIGKGNGKSNDQVFKVSGRGGRGGKRNNFNRPQQNKQHNNNNNNNNFNNNTNNNNNNTNNNNDVSCYSCGASGHKSNDCAAKKPGKYWCDNCKSKSHAESVCQKASHSANTVTDSANNNEHNWFCFAVKGIEESPPAQCKILKT